MQRKWEQILHLFSILMESGIEYQKEEIKYALTDWGCNNRCVKTEEIVLQPRQQFNTYFEL